MDSVSRNGLLKYFQKQFHNVPLNYRGLKDCHSLMTYCNIKCYLARLYVTAVRVSSKFVSLSMSEWTGEFYSFGDK